MHIDWSALGSMLSGIGTLVGAGVVIYATIVGRNTFEQWKLQKREERRIASAEQLLVATYKLRQAFDVIREDVVFATEAIELDKMMRERRIVTDETSSRDYSILRVAHAVYTRMAGYDADFDRLADMAPVAKAWFGETVADAMQTFWYTRNIVMVAAQEYEALASAPVKAGVERAFFSKDPGRREYLEKTIWGDMRVDRQNASDQLADILDEAVATLESELLPIIRNA